jgi:hypothetical protein
LGKFDVSLDLVSGNRRDIVVWRHLLEELTLVFLNDIFFLD